MTREEKMVNLITGEYTSALKDLFQQAADYEVRDYDEFFSKMLDLDMAFQDVALEAGVWSCISMDIDSHDLQETLKKHREKCSLQLAAMEWLDVFGCAEETAKRKVFVNDRNRICDERGTLLSSDGKHRVFEIIKGGKYRE